jgi:hypothetical protein
MWILSMLAEHFRKWIWSLIRLDEIDIDKVIECEKNLNIVTDMEKRLSNLEHEVIALRQRIF